MPRKKKQPVPIVGPGRDPENQMTVQKSRPLFSLWRSDMTLAEFKILDTYLSRINSHYPDKRTVIFTKGELEQLLGVTKVNKGDLSQRLNNLGRFVEVEKSDHKIHKVALFEEAYGEADENGFWQVKLTCTPSAMQYIFNIEELGYLRYKLRCITSLTSRYTYILFMYLESNRFRKTWEVPVDELRHILNCDTEPTYAEFKRFNDLILKKSQKELHEKSECRFAYEPIKKGRKVVSIKFTLETIPDFADELPGQLSMDELAPPEDLSPAELNRWETLQMYRKSLPAGLTDEEIWILEAMAEKKAPPSPISRENGIADYFHMKYLYFKRSNKKEPIKHPFAWLQKAIEND